MPQSIDLLHKKLLFFSIFLSIALHVIEIHFLQRQTLWFSKPHTSDISSSDPRSYVEKIDRDQILKEAFDTPVSSGLKTEGPGEAAQPVKSQEPTSLYQTLCDAPLSKAFLESPTHQPLFSSPPFPGASLYSSKLPLLQKMPFEENISLLPHLPRELISPLSSPLIAAKKSLPDPLTTAIHVLEDLPKDPIPIRSHPVRTPNPVLIGSSWAKGKFFVTPLSTPSFPSIPMIPSLHELQAASYSDSFDTEVVFFEIEDGYLFALTLIPSPSIQLTPLKQNYLFLIDRSNSIQKERLNATKNAVRKALDELNKNDQFNILVFDQKIEKLSPTMISASQESITKAQQFINKIELGSFFSQKNLYKPLFLTIPHTTSGDELYTAILMTDGENLSQKSVVQSLINDWTRMNQGKVSLYTLGMNEDPHLDILDTISNINRGKNFSSPTHRGLKRKLLKIMKTVHSPVAKNVTCKAISRNSGNGIELLPKTNHAPHLYLGEPYVILGKTKTLDDMVFFVQARLNNEWLHIKKNISFSNAKKGNASLSTEFAQLKSFDLYEQYLEGRGLQCLNQAQSLLKKHDLPQVFERVE